MNKRLQQFIVAENISQSQFADNIGVARASVSHIISGRNKPGFDFVEKMAKAFPALNVEWLITGKGKMYKTALADTPKESQKSDDYAVDLFSDSYAQSLNLSQESNSLDNIEAESDFSDALPTDQMFSAESPANQKRAIRRNSSTISKDRAIQSPTHQRNIVKIVIFYDDNTFQELK